MPKFRIVAWHKRKGAEVPYNLNLDLGYMGIELRLQCLSCQQIITRGSPPCCQVGYGSSITEFVAAKLKGESIDDRFDMLMEQALAHFRKEVKDSDC